MAINFPSSPVDGTTYSYQGVTYIWKEIGSGHGFWRINTPGTVGIATAAEIDAGTEPVKYVTPAQLELSKYNADFSNYGLGEVLAPFLNDLTGSVKAGYWYCPGNTPGTPDTDAYIINAHNGESVFAISETTKGKVYHGWRTNDSAGAFSWQKMAQTTNLEVFLARLEVQGGGETFIIRNPSTDDNIAFNSYLAFKGTSSRKGYFGFGNSSNANMTIANEAGGTVVASFSGKSGVIWHSGNDGAGSGLDADKLDGVQGSNYARTDLRETFTDGAVFQSSSGASLVTIKDTGGVGVAANPYIQYLDKNGTRIGYVGFGSTSIGDLIMRSDAGRVQVSDTSGAGYALSTANCKVVTETGSNSNGYYRIWSDGYKEMWGRIGSLGSNGTANITFPKTFTTADSITCQITRVINNSATGSLHLLALPTVSGASFRHGQSGTMQAGLWEARGY